MSNEMKSIFEELAPYARMVVVPGVTVGKLTYANQQVLYSTGLFSTNTAGEVAANLRVPLFNAALFEPAQNQGFSAGSMSLKETNSKFSKGQAPANQCFIATHAGFWLGTRTSTSAAVTTATEGLTNIFADGANSALWDGLNDTFTLAHNLSWDLTIGRGITRTIGTLAEYGAPAAYAKEAKITRIAAESAADTQANLTVNKGQLGSPAAQLKKLETPIVFPPLVNVGIEVRSGSPFQTLPLGSGAPGALVPTAQNFLVQMLLRGFLMTMPVA